MAEPDGPQAEKTPILKRDEAEQPSEWQTGLFDCWEDCHLSAVGLFCPQCLHADNATRLDRFASCGPYQCSYILVGGHHRRELRRTFALPEKPCGDYLVHCFCSLCALCQEAREIKRRSAVHPAPRLALALARRGQPPEVQRMTRTYSHGLALEDWEWDSESGKVGVTKTKSRAALTTPPAIAKAKAIRRGATANGTESSSLHGSVEQVPSVNLSERVSDAAALPVGGNGGVPTDGSSGVLKADAKPSQSPFTFSSPFDSAAGATAPTSTQETTTAETQRAPLRALSFSRGSSMTRDLSDLSDAELESLAGQLSMDMATAARAAARRIVEAERRQSQSTAQRRLDTKRKDGKKDPF